MWQENIKIYDNLLWKSSIFLSIVFNFPSPPRLISINEFFLQLRVGTSDRRDEGKKIEEENNIGQDKTSREYVHEERMKGISVVQLSRTDPSRFPSIHRNSRSEFPGEEENNERMKRETWAIRLKRLTEVSASLSTGLPLHGR